MKNNQNLLSSLQLLRLMEMVLRENAVSGSFFQDLIRRGILSDVFDRDCDFAKFDRRQFQQVLGLLPREDEFVSFDIQVTTLKIGKLLQEAGIETASTHLNDKFYPPQPQDRVGPLKIHLYCPGHFLPYERATHLLGKVNRTHATVRQFLSLAAAMPTECASHFPTLACGTSWVSSEKLCNVPAFYYFMDVAKTAGFAMRDSLDSDDDKFYSFAVVDA